MGERKERPNSREWRDRVDEKRELGERHSGLYSLLVVAKVTASVSISHREKEQGIKRERELSARSLTKTTIIQSICCWSVMCVL